MAVDHKARVRSLFVVHTAILVYSLGTSIIFTGVYPYLILVSGTGKEIEKNYFIFEKDSISAFSL